MENNSLRIADEIDFKLKRKRGMQNILLIT